MRQVQSIFKDVGDDLSELIGHDDDGIIEAKTDEEDDMKGFSGALLDSIVMLKTNIDGSCTAIGK